MKDIQGLLRQAQEIQARMAKLEGELAAMTVEASSGGGMVTVVMNGRQEVQDIRIDPEVVVPDGVGLLQDLVRGAVNEGVARSRRLVAEEMAKITGGAGLPGLF